MPDDEVARALNSAAIHLLRRMRPIDRRAGLTDARLSALSVLVFGGPQTVARLARAEGVASATMSRIVDGLVELGMARRDAHPDSGRMVMVSATDAGDHLMRAAAQRRIDAIAGGLAALPAADRDAILAAAPALLRLPDAIRD